MRKEALCMICNINIGRFKCGSCGRFVCEVDFDSSKGICSGCKIRY